MLLFTTRQAFSRPIHKNYMKVTTFFSLTDEFASNLPNLDNFSHITEANQKLTSQIDIEYPDLPIYNDGEIVNIDIIIKRENVIEEMLNLYKDETVVQKKIKVTFKDKLGLDYGGLTQELFSEFCKKNYIRILQRRESVSSFLILIKNKERFR